jgi:hypothetical protein
MAPGVFEDQMESSISKFPLHLLLAWATPSYGARRARLYRVWDVYERELEDEVKSLAVTVEDGDVSL